MPQSPPQSASSPNIVTLTGASGSGKTVIARHCVKMRPSLDVRHFDSIEIPHVSEMIKEYGSPEEWQRVTTHAWFGRLANATAPQILFEGQSRIEFIQSAIADHRLADCRVILIDCDDKTRLQRLTVDRQQPELATPDMLNWAAYLRMEASEAGCESLDTSHLTPEQSAQEILRHFQSE